MDVVVDPRAHVPLILGAHPQCVSLYSLDCPASLWVHFLMMFIFYLTHDDILYLMTCSNAGQEIATGHWTISGCFPDCLIPKCLHGLGSRV